jgi:diaminopimelate decarboxylase
LERAVEVGVGLINLESAGELHAVRDVAETMARKANIGVRVNPDVTTTTHPYTQTGAEGMKFGIPVDQVLDIASDITASPYLCLASIGMHLGSQITTARPYAEGAAKLQSLIAELRNSGVDTLRSVDVGGGMAIPYSDGSGLVMREFVEAVAPVALETGLTLLLEPGRLLVGNAGALITQVLYCKRSGGRTFAVVDAGMNDFMRPSYYQAEHEISVIGSDGAAHDSQGPVDVVGPICETGDYLGLARMLPGLKPGVLLAVHGAGAYGFSMSSNYNSRPRAAEVLVDGDRVGLIRARETIEDLWHREEADPQWLPSL